MQNRLIQLITKNFQLSSQERELCLNYFEPVSYPKNSILEIEGKIPNYLYFVVAGFVRLFYYNLKGEEVTTHLNCPPGFITSYSSFQRQTHSEENLECITACDLLRISKHNLDLLTQQSSSFKDFSIWVFNQSLAYNETRSKELATLSAEQRYLKLLEQQPEIIQNVPIQHIASFLGMNPKSLSRIRRQITR